MSRINKPWHLEHRMPRNPTPRQRAEWHREHARNCQCRPMPEGMKALIRSLGLEDAPARADVERD